MKIDMNATLRSHNTFGFDVFAEHLVHITDRADIPIFVEKANKDKAEWALLGGGSNLVLVKNISGYVGLMAIKGRRLSRETDSHFYVEAMAGENWHDFVAWALSQGYAGLENLALIPGTVGAAPIQNIGAYGLELADVLDSLEAFDTKTEQWVRFTKADCQFAYRDSIFKHQPHRYIVSSVCFALPKQWQANLAYAELAKALMHDQRESKEVSAKDIFNKVCEIRSAKLPDPRVLGNAGSFFHNPIVSNDQYEQLKQQFPQLVAYEVSAAMNQAKTWKLAAGWLIDQCGFKGYRQGAVGVYDKQALVLVNHGGGTGEQLLQLAKQIQQTVRDKFRVDLTIEPVILR
jgi:UDP-N-acetylmuramate dehydrogenase